MAENTSLDDQIPNLQDLSLQGDAGSDTQDSDARQALKDSSDVSERPSVVSVKAHSDPILPTTAMEVQDSVPIPAPTEASLLSAEEDKPASAPQADIPAISQGPIVRDFASPSAPASRLPANANPQPTASTSALPPVSPSRPITASRTGSAPAVPPSSTQAMPKGLGALRARGGGSQRNIPIPPSLQARVAAGLQNRNNAQAASSAGMSNSTHMNSNERIDAAALLNAAGTGPSSGAGPPKPAFPLSNSAAGPSIAVPGRQMPGGVPGGGLAARRRNMPGLNLGGMAETSAAGAAGPPGRVQANGAGNATASPARRRPPPGLSLGGAGRAATPFANFNKIVDPNGRLSFENKAVVHAGGVDFSTGASFNINMGDLTLEEELGRGNYGTVQRVLHKRTNVVMAMKEIRASAPEIVEFYGAFFIESCVYYCMEYMDAGSLTELAGGDVPENVLARVTGCMVRGLRFLKDELQTMHRDVKPTNVLVNKKGEIKLCDFGVSVQLEKSLAKTNIGCQSYMAPERIKGESMGAVSTYTVASDVWSLGLTMIEFTIGHYPYPPETYSNVFAQLQAIVHGDPPGLPDGYSDIANDFVAATLRKDANKRPSYSQLEAHPFLANDKGRDVDMVSWVQAALERRKALQTPSSSSSSEAPSPLP